jgi:tRNA nucleotidyltransferase (CCA-adding enzyme)
VAGGAVRDVLLGAPVRDVDLVVEGDALVFARRLARRLRAPVRSHPRFGTATIALPDGSRVDVAGSRRETYARPGALPSVSEGPLADDAARRDFTVNAMLLRLSPAPPRLLDPHGGRRDLAARRLRMLHSRSPHDDPTRAYRAVRYANRLGFRIVPATRRWIREALDAGAFERISADRRRREIERLFAEPRVGRAAAMLARSGLLAAIHPALARNDPRLRRALARAERRGAGSWFARLLILAAGLSEAEAGELAARLNLPRAQARTLRRWPARLRSAPDGKETPDERAAREALAAGRRPSFSGELRIGGRDLVRAGVPPGPAIGRALEATRAARLDRRIPASRELAFALSHARDERT